MSKIFVTGGSGFLGKSLCPALIDAGHEVLATTRNLDKKSPHLDGVNWIPITDMGEQVNWEAILGGVHVVVHLAARVHVMKESPDESLVEFRKINTEGTRRLAQAAVKAGVRRFIFLSTVKVNGEATPNGAFSENNPPKPQDAYAISKWEAEQALGEITANSDMELVILRPPLIYGEGAKANFLSLLKLCHMALPLPFGGINNRRSLIYVGNMVDIIICCLDHRAANNQIFLVRDGDDVSIAQLIRLLATALEKPARLFFVPQALLRIAGKITGKSLAISRLLDSLSVNDEKIRHKINWLPPFTMTQGLNKTAKWFISLNNQ